MNSTVAHVEKLSEYSFLPFSQVEEVHFKQLLDEYKTDRSSPEELSDAYESLGLSQLLDGDYVEAATNLECACTLQEDTLKGGNDEKLEHKLRTKFWCAVALTRIGQLEKAESYYTYTIQNVKRKKWDIFAAANSNIALIMVQLNKRKDLTTKFARAGLDAAARVYKQETLEYMHHLRVLLCTFMYFDDYNQVEASMDEAKGFPPLERALFQAGISFAKGRLEDAGLILNKALNGIEYEPASECGDQSVEPKAGERDEEHRQEGVDGQAKAAKSMSREAAADDDPVVAVAFRDGGDVDMDVLGLSSAAPRHRFPRKIDYISRATSIHDLICYALMKYNLTVLVAHKMHAAGEGVGSKVTAATAANRRASVSAQRSASVDGLSAAVMDNEEQTEKTLLFSLESVDIPGCMRDAADALERSCLMVKREMAERYHTPFNYYVEEHSQIVAKPSVRQNDGYGFYDIATLPQLMLAHILAAQGEWEVTSAVLLKAVQFQRAAFLKAPKGAGRSRPSSGAATTMDDTLSEGSAPTLGSGMGAAVEETKTSGRGEETEELLVLIGALKRFEAAAASMASGLSGHPRAIQLLKKAGQDDDDDLLSVESSDSVLSLGSGRYYKSKKFGRSKRVISQAIVTPEAAAAAATAAVATSQKPKQYADDIDTAASVLEPVDASLDDLATHKTNKDVALVVDLVEAYQSMRLMARGDEHSMLTVAQSTAAALGAVGIVLSSATGHVKSKKKMVKPNRHPSGHVREYQYTVAAVDPMRDEERPFTVKHEVIPFTKRHGRSVVGTFVQWALAVTGGIGYGFMGLGSPASLHQGVEMNCMSTDKGLLLYEVFARLAALEADFRKEAADSKVNRSSYRVEEQRNRFLLNAVMAKVSVQLGVKDECARAVDTMQKIMAELRRNSKPPAGEAAFSAIALKFQLDLEQLNLPLSSTFTSRTHLLMDTIAKSKDYLGHAERSKDAYLQRDALRRIMNALVEVGQMAQMAAEEEESTKVDGAGAGASSAHKKAGSSASHGHSHLARPEDLLKWSPKDMDSLEVHDEQWVARFGRLRALHYLDKLRSLAIIEEGGERFSGKFMPLRQDRSQLQLHSRVKSSEEGDDNDGMGGVKTPEGGAAGGFEEIDNEDDDADSEVDGEAEHEASLKYAREHASEWHLPLEKYMSLTSTRVKSELMSLSGGTFFMDKARKKVELLESEDRATGGTGVLAHAKSFRDFFEYGTPLGDDAEHGLDAAAGDEDDVDSDPETEIRRREEARLSEESSQRSKDANVDPLQDPKKKTKDASRASIRLRDRPRPSKSKKHVTIEGEEGASEDVGQQTATSFSAEDDKVFSEKTARTKSPKSQKS